MVLALITAGDRWQTLFTVFFLCGQHDVAVVLHESVAALAIDLAREGAAVALFTFPTLTVGQIAVLANALCACVGNVLVALALAAERGAVQRVGVIGVAVKAVSAEAVMSFLNEKTLFALRVEELAAVAVQLEDWLLACPR